MLPMSGLIGYTHGEKDRYVVLTLRCVVIDLYILHMSMLRSKRRQRTIVTVYTTTTTEK